MKEHLNTFSGGLNSDALKSADSHKNSFVDAQNIRIVSELGQSSLAVENIKGNIVTATIPGVANTLKLNIAYNVALDLLVYATTFTFNIELDGNPLLSITMAYTDPRWPSVFPMPTALAVYDWLAGLINTEAVLASVNLIAYSTPEGLFISYRDGYGTLSIVSSADASWDFGTDIYYVTYAPAVLSPVVIGYGNIRDTIVIFTTDCTTQDPGGANPTSLGQIWKLEFDSLNVTSTLTLLYNNYLDFSTKHPIQAVGRYENVDKQNIYWTDFNNYIRSFNVADPDAFTLQPDQVNMFPSFDFDPAILSAIVPGGSLDIGTYQLSYRLKRSSGSFSTLAMPSNMVAIYRLYDTDSYAKIVGEDLAVPSVPTGKRIVWTISNLDTSYDYLEPIIIKRTKYTSTPQVLALDPIAISNNGTATIDYSGTENQTDITIEEYLLLSTNFFDTCKTITTANNSLLIGNVRATPKLDLDFDARAYRFDNTATDTTYINLDLTNTDTWGVSESEDVINPHNFDPTEWLDFHWRDDRFKYCRDGVTLGGEGPNIKYSFVTRPNLDDTIELPSVNPFGGGGVLNENSMTPGPTQPLSATLNDYTYTAAQTIDNHKSSYISGLYRGYKRGETYRFGIVFYDLRGNPGYVKWIGDIRFPRTIENQGAANSTRDSSAIYTPLCEHSSATKETLVHQLGIKFEVNIPPSISSLISGYSIVRVKRDVTDRSVIANGYLAPIMDNGSEYTHPAIGQTLPTQNVLDLGSPGAPSVVGRAAKDGVLFYSPEYQFVRNSDILPSNAVKFGSDYLYVDSYQDGIANVRDRSSSGNDFYWAKLYNTRQTRSNLGTINIGPFTSIAAPTTPDSYYIKLRTITSVPRDSSLNLNGRSHEWYPGGPEFYNEAVRNSNNTTVGLGGVTTLLGLQAPGTGVSPMIFFHTAAGTEMNHTISLRGAKYTADICRLLTDQYGGQGYEARAINEYISCGHYQRVTTSSTTTLYTSQVFGGDIFANIWCNSKLLPGAEGQSNYVTSGNSPGAIGWAAYIPVESYINTHLRHGVFDNIDLAAALKKEDFLYNSVYSCENDIFKYFPKPSESNFTEVLEFDNRIYISEVKVNGESTDSWGVFRQANYIDLDGLHGPINNLNVYNSIVVAFQDKAIASLNIAPKFIVSDTVGTEEALLGTGKPLEGYNYLTTDVGSKHQWAIVRGSYAGEEAIYFFDATRKTLYSLSGNRIMPLIGQDAFLRNNIRGTILDNDNPIERNGITCMYDSVYNEAVFTFMGSRVIKQDEGTSNGTRDENLSLTIAYSAANKCFIGKRSYVPTIYIVNGDKTITPSSQDLYLHHYGPYGNFYGTVYTSNIKFIVNPEVASRKVLSSIGYIGEVIDADGYNQLGETWDRVRVHNDYQNTDWITLTPGSNVVRRERQWNFNNLRNAVYVPNDDIFNPNNLISVLPASDMRVLYPERLRDFYFMVELEYSNVNNRKIILPYVKSVYNSSAR